MSAAASLQGLSLRVKRERQWFSHGDDGLARLSRHQREGSRQPPTGVLCRQRIPSVGAAAREDRYWVWQVGGLRRHPGA
jgi:hypothetical protein